MHKKRHANTLTTANSVWKATYGSQWFTNTYHAQTPRQWAKQVLGNTFSIQSSKHILRALNRLTMQTQITSPKTPKTPKTPKPQSSSINLRTPSKYTIRTPRYNLRASP